MTSLSNSSISIYAQVKVSDAIDQHKDLLATLRIKCKDEIAKDPEWFDDDLFLVRFCLSQKSDEEKTVAAVKSTIAWRVEHKDLLAKLRSGWEHPDELKIRKYSPAQVHDGFQEGSVLFIVRAGLGNAELMLENCSDDEIKNAVIFSKEVIYHKLTLASRQTGLIKKMISISDLKDSSIFDMSRKMMTIMGEASKFMEEKYPQLVGRAIVCNPFTGMQTVMAIAKLLMPASMLEKMAICGGGSTRTGDVKTCAFAQHIFDLSKLPTFLGGKCTCADKGFKGCIANVPNDRREKVDPREEEVKK